MNTYSEPNIIKISRHNNSNYEVINSIILLFKL